RAPALRRNRPAPRREEADAHARVDRRRQVPRHRRGEPGRTGPFDFINEQHLSSPHDWDAFADYVNALARKTHWSAPRSTRRIRTVSVFEPRIVAVNVG